MSVERRDHTYAGGISWRLVIRVVAIVLLVIATIMFKGEASLAGWPPDALVAAALALWLFSETF